jgi:hypothetical protein
MKKELKYLAPKRWEKVGHQELCSIPYKQEIDPWVGFHKAIYTLRLKFALCAHLFFLI